MIKFLSDLNPKDLKNKRVLVRVDFNVVLNGGKIEEGYRIDAALPTLKFLLKNKAKIILISHLGRPQGRRVKKYSLEPTAKYLSRFLKKNVRFFPRDINSSLGALVDKVLETENIVMLENLRFSPEEEKNGKRFAKVLAGFVDIYVNDAFGASHRKHASVAAIPSFLPSYAGLLLEKEVSVLYSVFSRPQRPLTVIIGGAKMKTKVPLIKRFWDKANYILLGGAAANTLLFAKGLGVGGSRIDKRVLKSIVALDIANLKIHLPVDALVAKNRFTKKYQIHAIGGDIEGKMILDIGPDTIDIYKQIISQSKTVIWNGPMGYYENKLFAHGTEELLKTLAKSKSYSIVGGGDTIAVLHKLGLMKKISHVSTGGGAMLEFLSGKKLPGIKALEKTR